MIRKFFIRLMRKICIFPYMRKSSKDFSLDDLIFMIVLMLLGLGMVAGFFFGHL